MRIVLIKLVNVVRRTMTFLSLRNIEPSLLSGLMLLLAHSGGEVLSASPDLRQETSKAFWQTTLGGSDQEIAIYGDADRLDIGLGGCVVSGH